MGLRYILFRVGFEIKKKTGFLKRKFPINPQFKKHYNLESWKTENNPFFFQSKEQIIFNGKLSDILSNEYNDLSNFSYTFFSSLSFKLGRDYDWVTNPDTGHKYDTDAHWLEINDFDPKAGDIKYVWEPSRFSHLLTLIRYDKHSGIDCSKRVFEDIESWITANKINQGPNFKCSQEISLRVMNWTFALYYYKNSSNLTEEIFNKIQHHIYWQVEHVYQNINFSRIAVRNNHAITETLLLYIAGLLYPKFPASNKWKKDGKKWFEREIAYQIYSDGSFLQFSMNYHRVVVQLLTWALKISSLYNEKFISTVYERAESTLNFLTQHLDEKTGWLPNYGNNDGALFFKLSDSHYRDYRPQLQALASALNINSPFENTEDSSWYGILNNAKDKSITLSIGQSSFNEGGFYLYRSSESLTFIRCGNHKDRPAQADNLHLDLWHCGQNLLHDGGTYKYNVDVANMKYFMGTESHNTVMLESFDQMDKGARFIWYNWTQCANVKTEENLDFYLFEGKINAFNYIDEKITHKRRVKIFKNKPLWEIEDFIENKPKDLALNQMWHTKFPEKLKITSTTKNGLEINLVESVGYFSSYYGIKEECSQLKFSTLEDVLITKIEIV